jgi:hypothetical protein
MARMQSGPEVSDRALLTCVEMAGSAQKTVELEQAMGLAAGYRGEDSPKRDRAFVVQNAFLIDEEGRTVIQLSQKYQRICTMYSLAQGCRHSCKTYRREPLRR